MIQLSPEEKEIAVLTQKLKLVRKRLGKRSLKVKALQGLVASLMAQMSVCLEAGVMVPFSDSILQEVDRLMPKVCVKKKKAED